jgi:hypothetical protein
LLHHGFAKARIGARCASLRAGIALLDAINKHVVRAAFYVRVGADHLVSVHARLHVWFKSANVANAGKFL